MLNRDKRLNSDKRGQWDWKMMEREQMTDTKRGTDGMKENETGIKENDKRSSSILKDQLEIRCERKR